MTLKMSRRKKQRFINVSNHVVLQYTSPILKRWGFYRSEILTNLQSTEGLIQSDRSNGADDDSFSIST